MNNSSDEADEEILTCTLSDEELEAAAGTERRAYNTDERTWCYIC